MAPPFMNAYGLVPKVLDKIIEAQQPERFTQDFLSTKLGFSGGSARAVIPLLKRIGFLSSDGVPTPLYAKFRNSDSRGTAMAQALRTGYKEIFERNEYAQDMAKDKLKNLVVEMTGLKASDTMVTSIVGTFENLKKYANWDAAKEEPKDEVNILTPAEVPKEIRQPAENSGFNLSYTINLNLPETSDVEVFNAIFRSLKENLLRR
jgi:Family of unknown function (DUF5343)